MATSRSDQARPAPEVVAAIVAAVEVAWPKPTRTVRVPAHRPAGWRFSGRWWAPDDAVRRQP